MEHGAVEPSPCVTVIVTCFDQAHWIEQALDSVASQSETRIQLLVTDDGSSDGSPEVIQAWLDRHRPDGVLLAGSENAGLPVMLNRARPHIRGDFFAILNGDDWMAADRVERQLAAFAEADPPADIVYSQLQRIDGDEVSAGDVYPLPESNPPEGDLLADLVRGPVLGMGVAMVRTDLLDRIGPWDESLIADDYDFFVRAAAAGARFRYAAGVVLFARRVAEGLTRGRSSEVTDGRFVVLERQLGRNNDLDVAILRRMENLAVALHNAGYSRSTTRRRVWFVTRRAPTKRMVRVLFEQLLHLEPGKLSAWLGTRRCRD